LRRALALAAAAWLSAGRAAADGGTIRLRQDAGAFSITVFTAPEPLAAGSADVSVLVQDRASGSVVLDAEVEIRLRDPDGGSERIVLATPGGNRLLRSAAVVLPTPGPWRLQVRVRAAGDVESVECTLPVGRARSGLAAVWPYLAFPPFAVALFALRARMGRRSSAAASSAR
jgi:hypothetical protein